MAEAGGQDAVEPGSLPAVLFPEITSFRLRRWQIGVCWAVSSASLTAGGVATFMEGNDAGTAALFLVGIATLVIALVGRVPLRFEAGQLKVDMAYRAGIDRGLQAARAAVEESEDLGAPPVEVIERLSGSLLDTRTFDVSIPTQPTERMVSDGVGYTGRQACRAAEVTYRQIDYWGTDRPRCAEPSNRR